MKIKELLADVSVLKLTLSAEEEIGGLCCDSRQVRSRDLFVAIRGTRDDGNRYIDQARARGAAAIVAQSEAAPGNIPWIQVADARVALAQIACNFYRHPSHSIKLFGVTGTNGKTTVAGLLRDLLQSANRKTGLLSTVEYAYGERIIAAGRTTPDSIELQRLLAAMRDDNCEAAVMEVSSHALDQHRVGATRFAAVAFTNLTRDHLDYHQTMEAYFQAKSRLFEQLAHYNPGAPAVINIDDPKGQELLQLADRLGLMTLSHSINTSADITASDLQLDAGGTRFTLNTPLGSTPIKSALLGRFNVANMLTATGLALAAELPLERIATTLEKSRSRWGRLERVATPHPAAIFVDYAHTDDALHNVLATLRELQPRRLIVVFGCGGDRDRSKRPLMGRTAAKWADDIIITSDNPRTENPAAIIDSIRAGIDLSAAPAKTLHVNPDRREAIALALQLAAAGDMVLIAGKGHETYQEIEYHTTPFDDRAEVRRVAGNVH